MYQKLIILLMVSMTTSLVKSQSLPQREQNDSTLLVFASDTQAPMLIETIWLKAHQNRRATRQLFSEIGNRQPGSVFLLGDVVNLGYSNKQWRPMDGYLQHLRDRGITVDAILGNHEVMGRPRAGQRKFQERFPDHVRTGYVEVRDSVAVVLLNSNFKSLTKDEDIQQEQWYRQEMETLDANPAIQYIIISCHHSPYTNSKIVGCSKDVQEKFVPAFLQSKKGRLFLSGHCHNFEHYQIQGKDFMVIGGGGGLHQPLKTGEGCLPDLAKDYKPLFHYLTVQRKGHDLQVTSFELKDDFTGFAKGLEWDIMRNPTTGLATTTPSPAPVMAVHSQQN